MSQEKNPLMHHESNVEIDINEKVALGRYANLAIISHSPTEFVFDFAAYLPGMQKPRVNNRVLLTPEHAKRLFLSLKENIERYERNFGAIELNPQPQPQSHGAATSQKHN